MATANSNLQMVGLDFSDIKNNLITFLQSQDKFKDYNFTGSGLSVLLDILSYNTTYNAYYLNMVANEMFLDSSLHRNSVVSHAKLLGYTPKSSIAPSASIDLTVYDVTQPSLTLPKFTQFLSKAIDGTNYIFVTDDEVTVNIDANNTVAFSDIIIKQGTPVNYSFEVDLTANPKCLFEIPDENIDTTSLVVTVQQSYSNTYFDVYKTVDNALTLDGNSYVYFLQEGLSNKYELYFGNGILGKQLSSGNIVRISYISTNGTSATGANSFTLMQGIGGYANTKIQPITAASNGSGRESIDSIKFQAPKSFSAQNRAVTKDDYITIIQQNNIGLSFDAVNVWGGEENNPPVYGKVFISLKPKGSYNITETQKQRLITDVIKPISVMTVSPIIVEPDYTYIKLDVNVPFNSKLTTKTASQIQTGVKTTIGEFAIATLNTFNSTFNPYKLLSSIQSYDPSIITSDYTIRLEKKFLPNFTRETTVKLYFGTALQRGTFLSGVSSSPALSFVDQTGTNTSIDNVFIEEIPAETNGVSKLAIINPGVGYQYTPTLTIVGDGYGATADVTLTNGSISSITVTNAGYGYTSATATITPQANDTTGALGTAVVVLNGDIGSLRTVYTNSENIKTVLSSNIGTIDYENGIITLNNFMPLNVNNPLGELTISAKPKTNIISSSFNRIITIDPFDPTAITVNVTEQSL